MRVGIALGSGGAKGLAHIAFLKALDELEIRPSIVSGSSMGALIGALYCSGLSGNEIEKIFKDIRWLDIIRLLDLSFAKNGGLIKGERIISQFKKSMKERFEDLEIPLKVVAVDFWKRDQVVFNSGDLAPAVRASIAIPGIFEPVVLDGAVLMDGGLVNPVPYDLLKEEADLIIAIDVLSREGIEMRPNLSMKETIMFAHQIMQNTIERLKVSIHEPDISVRLCLQEIGSLEFHKTEEALNAVRKDVDDFKVRLKEMMG